VPSALPGSANLPSLSLRAPGLAHERGIWQEGRSGIPSSGIQGGVVIATLPFQRQRLWDPRTRDSIPPDWQARRSG